MEAETNAEIGNNPESKVPIDSSYYAWSKKMKESKKVK